MTDLAQLRRSLARQPASHVRRATGAWRRLGACVFGALFAPVLALGAPDTSPSAPTTSSTVTVGQVPASAVNVSAIDTLAVDAQSIDDFMSMDLQQILEIPVNQVATTASKLRESTATAAAVVSVVDAAEIRLRGFRTVGEALGSLAGIYVVDDHVYTHVGIRGLFSTTRTPNDLVKVMINGQPVSFRPNSATFVGLELIPITAVKRIEVVKGPGSALYGANAFFGVVNVVTYSGMPRARPSLEPTAGALTSSATATAEATAIASSGVATNIGHGYAAIDTTAYGPLSSSWGYLAAVAMRWADRSGLVVPGLDDIRAQADFNASGGTTAPYRGFPSPMPRQDLRLALLDNPESRNDIAAVGSAYVLVGGAIGRRWTLEIDAHAQYFDTFTEFAGNSYLTHETRDTYLNAFVRSRLSRDLESDGALRLSITFSGGQPLPWERFADPVAPDTHLRRHVGYKALSLQSEFDQPLGDDHRLLVGADLVFDSEDLLRLELVDPDTGAITLKSDEGHRNFITTGAYARWTWRMTDAMSLTLGHRSEYNSLVACDARRVDCVVSLGDDELKGVQITHRGALAMSHRIGITYALPWWSDEALGRHAYLKALFGSSYKPPSPLQMFQPTLSTGVQATVGSPDLRPQNAETLELELGARQGGLFDFSVTGFLSFVDNVVDYIPGFLIQARNVDATFVGLEASLSWQVGTWLRLRANGHLQLFAEARPQQSDDESDAVWENSLLNVSVPAPRFPDGMARIGATIFEPKWHFAVDVDLRYVSLRRASLENNLHFARLDLERTYALDAYWTGSLALSTVGWSWFGEEETSASVRIDNIPGLNIEPGSGGIDIPNLGPVLELSLRQDW